MQSPGTISACFTVRGKPSRRKPFLQGGESRLFSISSTTISSLTCQEERQPQLRRDAPLSHTAAPHQLLYPQQHPGCSRPLFTAAPGSRGMATAQGMAPTGQKLHVWTCLWEGNTPCPGCQQQDVAGETFHPGNTPAWAGLGPALEPHCYKGCPQDDRNVATFFLKPNHDLHFLLLCTFTHTSLSVGSLGQEGQSKQAAH